MTQIVDYFKIKGTTFMGTSDNLALLLKLRWQRYIRTQDFLYLEFIKFASDQRGKDTEIHNFHCSILCHNLRLVSELLV